MPLVPITPPAGVVTNGTEYANKNRWVDSNLIRFQNGYLTPIKGWEKLNASGTGLSFNMFGVETS